MATYKALTESNCKDFKNFKYSEFKCKCGGKYCKGYPVAFSYELAKNLQTIRDKYKKAVIITSPLRCKKHNTNVGGTANSPHMKGFAVDFYISGVSYNTLFAFVKTLPYYSYAYRIKKNQDVIHYSITPPNENPVTPTVTRDETKDQIKVLATELRVRASASVKSSILGVAVKGGIYNFFETKKDASYTWYRIAEAQWVADNDKYLEVYDKKEQKSDEIEKLKKELEEANLKIHSLENELELANQKIQNLEIELAKKDNYKFSFIASTNGKYKINLNKNENLIIK